MQRNVWRSVACIYCLVAPLLSAWIFGLLSINYGQVWSIALLAFGAMIVLAIVTISSAILGIWLALANTKRPIFLLCFLLVTTINFYFCAPIYLFAFSALSYMSERAETQANVRKEMDKQQDEKLRATHLKAQKSLSLIAELRRYFRQYKSFPVNEVKLPQSTEGQHESQTIITVSLEEFVRHCATVPSCARLDIPKFSAETMESDAYIYSRKHTFIVKDGRVEVEEPFMRLGSVGFDLINDSPVVCCGWSPPWDKCLPCS